MIDPKEFISMTAIERRMAVINRLDKINAALSSCMIAINLLMLINLAMLIRGLR